MDKSGMSSKETTGLPIKEALKVVAQELAAKKGAEGNSPEINLALAKLLENERVYSGPIDITKDGTLKMEFRSLRPGEIEMTRRIATTNFQEAYDKQGNTTGVPIKVDEALQSQCVAALALYKINDTLVQEIEIPDQPNEDQSTAILAEIRSRREEFFGWHAPLRANFFSACGAFLDRLNDMFDVETLRFFSKPPMDSSSQKSSDGGEEA